MVTVVLGLVFEISFTGWMSIGSVWPWHDGRAWNFLAHFAMLPHALLGSAWGVPPPI